MKTIDIIRQIESLATELEERGLTLINWDDWDEEVSAHLALPYSYYDATKAEEELFANSIKGGKDA